MCKGMPRITELWEFLGDNGWDVVGGYVLYKNGCRLACFSDSTKYGWHLVLDNRESYYSNEYRYLHIGRDMVRYLYCALADPDMGLDRVEIACERAELAKKLEGMPG